MGLNFFERVPMTMTSIWKAITAFLLIILLLTGGGLVAGKYVFAPWERVLSENQSIDDGQSEAISSGISQKDYKKIRLAFNSFDLAAGLTKSDFESIPAGNTYSFAALWLCAGAVFFLKKPRKQK